MANHVEGQPPDTTLYVSELRDSLGEALRNVKAEALRELPSAKAQSLIDLLQAIDDLTSRLSAEVAAEPAGL